MKRDEIKKKEEKVEENKREEMQSCFNVENSQIYNLN